MCSVPKSSLDIHPKGPEYSDMEYVWNMNIYTSECVYIYTHVYTYIYIYMVSLFLKRVWVSCNRLRVDTYNKNYMAVSLN